MTLYHYYLGVRKLKNYSVTDQEFKSQIQWLKAHDAKF